MIKPKIWEYLLQQAQIQVISHLTTFLWRGFNLIKVSKLPVCPKRWIVFRRAFGFTPQ
jgi:hypothetical protein